VFACLASLLLFSQGAASAGTVLVFGQNAPDEPISFTSGASGETITATNVAVQITTLGGVAVPPIAALFNMTATSTGTATVAGGVASQAFSGTFSVTSGTTNFLSGTWTGDMFTGTQGGHSGSMFVSDPPSSLTFTSSVIPAGQLGTPNSFSIAFAGINPAIAATNGGNLGNYSASVAFTSSAVPEPGTLVLMSIAGPIVFCFGGMRRFLRRNSGRS
jgi:hypothetical protein